MPRDRAQRRLPSMMIATCVSPRSSSGPGDGRAASGSIDAREGIADSDLQDLLFLVVEQSLTCLICTVGQLLHLVGPLLVLVLGDLAVLLQPLELLHAVAPDVADRHPRLLGVRVRDLGQLVAPLLRSARGSGTRISWPSTAGLRPRSSCCGSPSRPP